MVKKIAKNPQPGSEPEPKDRPAPDDEQASAEPRTEQTEVPKPKNQTKKNRSDDRGGKAAPSQGQTLILPIVGIGASAGGLEAFEKFFTHMPADSGMAFVLVQHLDPTHKSILVELVKRYTQMNVFEVVDGMPVEANCTYIIPPNRDMAILHGELHLMEPVAPRGHRGPIDYFFRSLADEQGELAIGIVLSGTGSEGAQGIRSIKGGGGMAIVQEPESAKYDGMPRSAIATGVADYILPPEEMPQQLISYVRHAFGPETQGAAHPIPKTEQDLLAKVFILLRNETGHDFSYYKQNTIRRRIARRLVVHKISDMQSYVRYLQGNRVELEILFRTLLIGVTSFFRDPDAWESLKENAIPGIFEGRLRNQPIRVWIAGCSSGEEAYSCAILFQEYMDAHDLDFKIQIFATDIDSEAIEKARLGIYPESIEVDVPAQRLQRYFHHENNTYTLKSKIRDMIVFATQNVIKDPPFSRLDMISCRNLLIYLQPELQKRVLALFRYALVQDGILLLGNSESVGDYHETFKPIDRKWKLFQVQLNAMQGAAGIEIPDMPNVGRVLNARVSPPNEEDPAITIRELVERILLNQYTPTCIAINGKGDALYIHGRTGKFLELPSGDISVNIFKMARQGLRQELTTATRKAISQKKLVRQTGLQVKENGSVITVNLTVFPVLEPPGMRDLALIMLDDVAAEKTFQDRDHAPGDPDHDKRIAALERELKAKEEYLQITVEQLETSNEELKSTNEEMQSSNEELQSTNEELETSKEELQSVNEELITVNTELQKKIDELSWAYNDMNNLLASTEIATVFLDLNMSIKRFTPAVTQIIPLIQSDVDRPISDITTELEYDRLAVDVKQVLKTLIPIENEVMTGDGRWYWMRIIPYRTSENVIDGVVLTFMNVTGQKNAQLQLSKFNKAVEQSSSIVMITNASAEIEYVSPRFTEVSGYTEQEVLGRNPRFLKSGAHSKEFYAQMWNTILSGNTWQGKLCNKNKDGTLYWMSASISPVRDPAGRITHFIAVKEAIATESLA